MAGDEQRRPRVDDWQGEVFREMAGGRVETVGGQQPGPVADRRHAGASQAPPRPADASGLGAGQAPPARPAARPQPPPAAPGPPPQRPPTTVQGQVVRAEPTPSPAPGQVTPAASPPGRMPAAAPVTATPVAPDEERALGRVRHGDPVGRRALRAARRLLSSATDDAASHAHAARLIQQPITTGRQISVTSIRGGAGKSTVAALLALTFGHFRSDPVLAVEADAVLGTLPRRLGARAVRWSCADVARIVDPSMRITDVTGYLVPFTGGWLLPGSRGEVNGPLDSRSYWAATTALRRFFGTTVIDCQTLPAEVARLALVTSQARVLVTPATPEGVATTRWVLDWVGGLGAELLRGTVVALVHASPDTALDQRWAAEQLQLGGARMVPVPYDRSLAAGGEIRPARLGQGVRQAATRLAAEAMDRAVKAG